MTAPLILNVPMNRVLFLAYVQQALVSPPKSRAVVIMDNLAVHKSVTVRNAIEAVVTRLRFLPHDGPDLNPIEHAFSKL